MNRRKFVKQTSLATTALILSRYTNVWGAGSGFPVVRIPEGNRNLKAKP